MRSPRGSRRSPDAARAAQRAVLLALLAADGDGVCPRALRRQLGDLPLWALAAALLELERNWLICLRGARLCASPAARHLDRLGLLAV